MLQQENKVRFLSLLRETNRDGVESLIEWLESTDFFDAPASAKYHLAKSGGLVCHSLHVYDELVRLKRVYPEIVLTKETAIIIALLHDLCKTDFYKSDVKNVKLDGQWTQVPYYTVEEKFVFGLHGGKSAFLAMKHIKLTDEEAVAITNHMGGFHESPQNAANVYAKWKLAWLLHVADESATYVKESDDE